MGVSTTKKPCIVKPREVQCGAEENAASIMHTATLSEFRGGGWKFNFGQSHPPNDHCRVPYFCDFHSPLTARCCHSPQEELYRLGVHAFCIQITPGACMKKTADTEQKRWELHISDSYQYNPRDNSALNNALQVDHCRHPIKAGKITKPQVGPSPNVQ